MPRWTAYLVSVALLLGACSQGGPDPSTDPKAALVSALKRMADSEGVTMTMSVNSDVASLQALSGDGGEPMSEQDAEKILESSLVVSSRTSEDPADAQSEMSVTVAGLEDAVEIKVLGRTFYVRADVRGLLEALEQDPALADDFVRQGQATGIDFADEAVAGEWLQIDNFDEVTEQLTGQPVQETPSAEQAKAFRQLGDAIERDARVREGDEEGPGTHLVTTINIRDAYGSFMEIAGSLGTGAFAPGLLPPAEQVPNETVEFDVWVEDDFVTQVEFAVPQLAKFDESFPEGVENMALRLGFDEFTGEVEAPGGAVTVDPQQIAGLLFGGAGAGAAPPGAPSQEELDEICAQLEGQPPEVLEQVGCPT